MRLFLPKYLSHDLPSAGAFTFSLTPDALEADVAPTRRCFSARRTANRAFCPPESTTSPRRRC